MIRSLLVANRGEIAVRIIRACRELGVESIAVYSDADAGAPHVTAADRAYRIGPAPARESYLDIDSLIRTAGEAGADAVHPGYGFLSERAAFARACERAGLTFVGPPAAALERMGSKTGARDLMHEAGVPIVPGLTPGDQSDEALSAAVLQVGFPALLKPAAGGGGIGMKTLRAAEEVATAIAQARREALAAFGDGTLYVERLIERPRHVEVQIFADTQGNVVHLFERECSIQRRHQKVVEESPCTVLTPALRARMGEAAVAAARAAHYVNAGTVEFLLDGSGADARFYFLEMNTRLQVEHPVTEAVVGVDLVQAQLRVAAGEAVPWRQDDLSQRGHAIECRVYAEDPARNFLPQAGTLVRYDEPRGPGIRVDSGYAEATAVSVYYDPLVAKVIVSAETRTAAISRMRVALRQFAIDGIRTNIPFLLAILEQPRFVAGDIDTHFLDSEGEALRAQLTEQEAQLADRRPAATTSARGHVDPFTALGAWRAGDAPQAHRGGPRRASSTASRRGVTHDMRAPMPATVVKVFVAPGTAVKKGDTILTLEAMKMELPIKAARDGVVRAVFCRPGELVQPGVNLIDLEA